MIVDFFEQGDVLRFSFTVEEGDKVIPSEKFQMGGRDCYFRLPRKFL